MQARLYNQRAAVVSRSEEVVRQAINQIQSKIGDDNKKSQESDFEKLQKLGSGSFGVVYTVRRKQDKKLYVMKVVDTRKMNAHQKRESVLEATIMSKV